MNFKHFFAFIAVFSAALAASSCDNTQAAVQNIAAGFSNITSLIEDVRVAFMSNHVNPSAIRASLKPLEQAATNLEKLIGTTCLTGDQINQLTASSANLMNEITNLGFSAIYVLRNAAIDGDTDQMRLVVREIMFSVRTLANSLAQVSNQRDWPQLHETTKAVEALIATL